MPRSGFPVSGLWKDARCIACLTGDPGVGTIRLLALSGGLRSSLMETARSPMTGGQTIQILTALCPALVGLLAVSLSRRVFAPLPASMRIPPGRRYYLYRVARWLPIETYSQALPVACTGLAVNVAVYLARRSFHSSILTKEGPAGDLWIVGWGVFSLLLLVILGLWVRPWWTKEYQLKRRIALSDKQAINWSTEWPKYVELRGDIAELRDWATWKAWGRQGCHWGLAFSQLFLAVLVVAW